MDLKLAAEHSNQSHQHWRAEPWKQKVASQFGHKWRETGQRRTGKQYHGQTNTSLRFSSHEEQMKRWCSNPSKYVSRCLGCLVVKVGFGQIQKDLDWWRLSLHLLTGGLCLSGVQHSHSVEVLWEQSVNTVFKKSPSSHSYSFQVVMEGWMEMSPDYIGRLWKQSLMNII